jgi:hypothetical protein
MPNLHEQISAGGPAHVPQNQALFRTAHPG